MEAAPWYEIQYDHTRLGPEDAAWLSKLSDQAIDEVWLAKANNIVALGSINLRNDTDPATIGMVHKARVDFYETLLGWADDGHPLNLAYKYLADTHYRAMPIATVIGTQRVLNEHGR